MFDIRRDGQGEILAVVACGWEDRDYYVEWLGWDDPDIIDTLEGPVLNPGSPRTDHAPAILEAVTDVLQDDEYVERLERHYHMFKDAIQTSR